MKKIILLSAFILFFALNSKAQHTEVWDYSDMPDNEMALNLVITNVSDSVQTVELYATSNLPITVTQLFVNYTDEYGNYIDSIIISVNNGGSYASGTWNPQLYAGYHIHYDAEVVYNNQYLVNRNVDVYPY